MKVIDINKWGKFTGREALCSLPLSVNEFSQRTGIELEEFAEDGLGVCYCAFIQIRHSKYFVQGFVSRDSKSPPLSIDMEGNQPQPMSCLQDLLIALGLTAQQLPWIKNDLAPPQWAILRQCDDGDAVEVSRYFRESAAQWVLKQLQSDRSDYVVSRV
ncbi:hypothetical protein FT643_16820 [Ketobacter sp. MCCC 1A13808]|uniref:hypothetical protein n=1 Tax=Ketobacter sp. MCCC 1A13808 TaxID=2602738 RepID=UPI0012ECAB09|nr:hypothetical protein [Ketobacter sp. MCCC 1A13808]MVF13806.1 hypothetical protein [Ketobacter sp. MCCC 1A13808]